MRSRLYHAVVGVAFTLVAPTSCAPAADAVSTEAGEDAELAEDVVEVAPADTGADDTRMPAETGRDSSLGVDAGPDVAVDSKTNDAMDSAIVDSAAAMDASPETAADVLTDAPTAADGETGWHPTK